jgi:hypothetical protein
VRCRSLGLAAPGHDRCGGARALAAMPPLTWQSQPSTSGVTGHGRCGGGMSSRGDAAAPSASRPRSRSVRWGHELSPWRCRRSLRLAPRSRSVRWGHELSWRCRRFLGLASSITIGAVGARALAAMPPLPPHRGLGHGRCGGGTSSRGAAAAPSASRVRSRSVRRGHELSRRCRRSLRIAGSVTIGAAGHDSRRAMPPLARQGQPSTSGPPTSSSGPTSAWGTGALTGSPATRPRVTR